VNDIEARSKARFAADQDDEPYSVVEGPYGFEIFKTNYAVRTWPHLVRYTAYPVERG
jgi:hypothetical protein